MYWVCKGCKKIEAQVVQEALHDFVPGISDPKGRKPRPPSRSTRDVAQDLHSGIKMSLGLQRPNVKPVAFCFLRRHSREKWPGNGEIGENHQRRDMVRSVVTFCAMNSGESEVVPEFLR